MYFCQMSTEERRHIFTWSLKKKIKENEYMIIKMDFQKNVWDQSIAYFLNL